MNFENKPFEQHRTQEERDSDKRKIEKVSFNDIERKQLREDMLILRQSKKGTALKQLWQIGRLVLHGTPEGITVKLILENLRRNSRSGIVDIATEINANVALKTENR